MRVLQFIRALLDAFRHVRSGGQTTRVRAVRRASAPPKRCRECRQELPHSADWRDHISNGSQ